MKECIWNSKYSNIFYQIPQYQYSDNIIGMNVGLYLLITCFVC